MLALTSAGCASLPARQVQLDIDQQPMNEALIQWAEQAGLNIIVPDMPPETDRVTLHRVRGTMTPIEGLAQILAQSKLTYVFINARTVAISLVSDGRWESASD